MLETTMAGRFLILFPMLAMSFSFAPSANGTAPDAALQNDMRQIRKFVAVEVQTQGTADKLGISGAELTDVMRVTLLNKVPGIVLEGSSGAISQNRLIP